MSIEIRPAEHCDLQEIAALVNSAYRGDSSRAGWNTEADLVGGQRTDAETLRAQLTAAATILGLRRAEAGPIDACVFLENKPGGKCYLGMLTVKPTLQTGGIGRALLARAEQWAKENWECDRVVMTVISVRHSLIAWYERRGYSRTGRTEPFPYGDPKFGEPKVDGLFFEVLEKRL